MGKKGTAIYGMRIAETFEVSSVGQWFSLSKEPIQSSLAVFINGVPTDWDTEDFDHENFMFKGAKAGDIIRVNYAPAVGLDFYTVEDVRIGELPTGEMNGVNNVFFSQSDFIPESLTVELNGLTQSRVIDFYTVGKNQIVFAISPAADDFILISYVKG